VEIVPTVSLSGGTGITVPKIAAWVIDGLSVATMTAPIETKT
jgi:hypothetical protein